MRASRLLTTLIAAGVLVTVPGTAFADDSTVPVVGPDNPAGGGGIPGFVGFLFVIAILLGVGTTVYRVKYAADLAERRGRDRSEGVKAALLGGDEGLAAVYLDQNPQGTAAPVPGATVQQRLADVDALQEAGTITADEHATQRARILDSL